MPYFTNILCQGYRSGHTAFHSTVVQPSLPIECSSLNSILSKSTFAVYIIKLIPCLFFFFKIKSKSRKFSSLGSNAPLLLQNLSMSLVILVLNHVFLCISFSATFLCPSEKKEPIPANGRWIQENVLSVNPIYPI